MDGIIEVVSAAETLSNKPQLLQHMQAIQIGNFKNVIVLFNKLDLITKEVAIQRKKNWICYLKNIILHLKLLFLLL